MTNKKLCSFMDWGICMYWGEPCLEECSGESDISISYEEFIKRYSNKDE